METGRSNNRWTGQLHRTLILIGLPWVDHGHLSQEGLAHCHNYDDDDDDYYYVEILIGAIPTVTMATMAQSAANTLLEGSSGVSTSGVGLWHSEVRTRTKLHKYLLRFTTCL